MIEWIDILTGLAVALAVLAIGLLFLVVVAFARRLLPRRKPVQLIPQKEIKKEKPQMSKEKGEGVTFNDIFMFMIAVPLVLLWVGFAGFVIHSGLNDAAVLEQIEGYTTLIAILGGPALLIIKDALDVWKQEQAEKTAFYKVKAQAVIDYNDSMQKQAQMIEAKAQEQEHKMESNKK
jgi:sterol desaturase/sphingolipid hydroxylase (fatty acid hydroxylase superfamily)